MSSLTARRITDGKVICIDLQDGLIHEIRDAPAEEQPDDVPWVAPGLFDIQVNGYNGHWFSSDRVTVEDIGATVQALADQGIAACFPTLVTNSFQAITHGMATLNAARRESPLVAAVVRGIHLEGPWISADDGPRGAHPREHVRPPSRDEFQRWQDAADGQIRIVTLAPETEGAPAMIEWLTDKGVVVSIGHSAATAEQIKTAADCGARLSTHLGNGVSGTLPRHPNLLWQQLAEDRLWASVISDGWHLPLETLKCMLRCKTLQRMVITCDVSGFGGCPPGVYQEGRLAAEVLDDGRIVSAGQRQYLAGSGATTGECVLGMAAMCDIPLGEAWDLASAQPSRLMWEDPVTLESGSEATLTLFRIAHGTARDQFVPVATIVRGRQIASHAH